MGEHVKQTDEEIVAGYEKPDPWGYQNSGADLERKRRIVEACNEAGQGEGFDRALDIACGEAWITQDLPAYIIHGYELSAKARARFPGNVEAVLHPDSGYDLVLCTGALYEHYDWQHFVELIENHASDVVVTCAIGAWEYDPAIDRLRERFAIRSVEYFAYPRPEANYNQCLRVWRRYPESVFVKELLA